LFVSKQNTCSDVKKKYEQVFAPNV